MATPIELESEEEKYLSVWDELGKHLDNDMPPEDLQQGKLYGLMTPGDLQRVRHFLLYACLVYRDVFSDSELSQRQMYGLMPPKDLQLAMQLLRDKLPSDFQADLPSDVLRFLQNNYLQGRALSIMKHVLRIMDSHHQGKTTWSHVSLFEEYETKLKAFDKNETFVGRQEELNEILGMFSPLSEIKGW